jgi:HSP20 family protein
MTLIRWQPRRDLDFGPKQFRRMFGDLENAFSNGFNFELGSYVPRVDVSEDDKAMHFVAELPGLKPEDVKVTISEGVLTIRGEKKRVEEEKSKNYHRIERSFGEFVRQFALPENVSEDVTANFSDGMLDITVAKKEPEKPKEREIKIGSNSNKSLRADGDGQVH